MPLVIPRSLQRWILTRDQGICRMCGAKDGDLSETKPRSKVAMTLGVFVPLSIGGKPYADNIRTLCSECAEGLKTAPYIPRPTVEFLIQQMSVGSDECQKDVLRMISALMAEQPNSICQNFRAPVADRIHLFSLVGRATIEDQRAVLEWLQRKFTPKPEVKKSQPS